MRRPWVFDSGEEAHDVIRRCVLGPRELELYATLAGFDVVEITNESGAGSLTGGRSCDRSSNIPSSRYPNPSDKSTRQWSGCRSLCAAHQAAIRPWASMRSRDPRAGVEPEMERPG
ncbi:hypothetical protein ACFV80_27525 [Streptomyces sp. NPDC059862]|uniref:hypothetical protein n=1 Tax=Streptomyces sp. NPDC059862 TaxID=3346975 RepID=UPI003654F7DC